MYNESAPSATRSNSRCAPQLICEAPPPNRVPVARRDTSGKSRYFLTMKNGTYHSITVPGGEVPPIVWYRGRYRFVLIDASDEEYFATYPKAIYRMVTCPGSDGYNYQFKITVRGSGVYAFGDRYDFDAAIWRTPKNLSPRARFHIAIMAMLTDPHRACPPYGLNHQAPF